jgi:hypothetical protein
MVAINVTITRPDDLGAPPVLAAYHIHVFKRLASDTSTGPPYGLLPPPFPDDTVIGGVDSTPALNNELNLQAAVIEKDHPGWEHMFSNQTRKTATISLIYDPDNNVNMFENGLERSDTTVYYISIRAVNDFGGGPWKTADNTIQYLPSGEFIGVRPDGTSLPVVTVHNWRASHKGVPGVCFPFLWDNGKGPINAPISDESSHFADMKLYDCLDKCTDDDRCTGVHFSSHDTFDEKDGAVTIPETAVGECFHYKFGPTYMPNVFDVQPGAAGQSACFVLYDDLHDIGNGKYIITQGGSDTYLVANHYITIATLIPFLETKLDGNPIGLSIGLTNHSVNPPSEFYAEPVPNSDKVRLRFANYGSARHYLRALPNDGLDGVTQMTTIKEDAITPDLQSQVEFGFAFEHYTDEAGSWIARSAHNIDYYIGVIYFDMPDNRYVFKYTAREATDPGHSYKHVHRFPLNGQDLEFAKSHKDMRLGIRVSVDRKENDVPNFF